MSKIDYRYLINENEREEILQAVRIGIWRIERMADQLPRMYGDANLYAMLGAELQMQPEQLYQYWYEGFEPLYFFNLEKTAERLHTEGHPTEIEYIWNHPQYGKILVRWEAALTPSQEDGAIVMHGTCRIITDQFAENNGNESGYQIVDDNKILHLEKYLVNAYEEIFSVDVETKSIHRVAYRKDLCSGVEDGKCIEDVIEKWIFSEDRKRVCSLFSDESIREILAKKGSVSIEFRRELSSQRAKWLRGTLYPVQSKGMDELLFVVQDIHSENMFQMLKEEQEDILESVIHNQAVVYVYDVESQQLQILKYDVQNIRSSVASAKLQLTDLAERLCVYYIDRSEWAKAKKFLSYHNINSCAEQKCKKFISLQLDTTQFHYDYVKLSLLPSARLKAKVYLVMEIMDQKEWLYPVLESHIRNTLDHFYYLDLKKGYFFQLVGDAAADEIPPAKGYDYTRELIRYVDKFVPEEDRALVKEKMSPEFILQTLEHEKEFTIVESFVEKNGEVRKKLFIYRPFDLSKGHVLLQRTDITDQYHKEQMLEKAQWESITDPLTQLYNRFGSEKLIKKALSETDESKNPVIIILDVDNFKDVNDQFGHPAGDRLLCEVAQQLRKCFRTGDIIGRLGGDEYIIFLQSILHHDDIYSVLQRVVQETSLVCKNEAESITVTVSAGATFYRGHSYEELYREADIALYHAKREKNTYSVFDDVKK